MAILPAHRSPFSLRTLQPRFSGIFSFPHPTIFILSHSHIAFLLRTSLPYSLFPLSKMSITFIVIARDSFERLPRTISVN